MTDLEIIAAIIQNDSIETGEQPSYILKDTFQPTERESALLEDSDFLFMTKEHQDNFAKRLGVANNFMANLWRKAGNMPRYHIFMNVHKQSASVIAPKPNSPKEK